MRRPSPSPSLIDDALRLRERIAPTVLMKLAFSSLKCVCAFRRRGPFGSAVADHHAPLSASRRNRKLPMRSSVGSACQRVTADVAEAAVAGAGRRHHHRILAVRHDVGGLQRHRRIEDQAGVGMSAAMSTAAAVGGFRAHRRDRGCRAAPFPAAAARPPRSPDRCGSGRACGLRRSRWRSPPPTCPDGAPCSCRRRHGRCLRARAPA